MAILTPTTSKESTSASASDLRAARTANDALPADTIPPAPPMWILPSTCANYLSLKPTKGESAWVDAHMASLTKTTSKESTFAAGSGLRAVRTANDALPADTAIVGPPAPPSSPPTRRPQPTFAEEAPRVPQRPMWILPSTRANYLSLKPTGGELAGVDAQAYPWWSLPSTRANYLTLSS